MSDFGLRCRNASGNITLDTTNEIIRFRKRVDLLANASGSTFIADDVNSTNSDFIIVDIDDLESNFNSFNYYRSDRIPDLSINSTGYLVYNTAAKSTISVSVFVYSNI